VPEEAEKDVLKRIQTVLEDTKGLLLVLNQDKLDEMKKRLLKAGFIESQVYDLCDGTNTAQTIATSIQKTPDYASAVIGNLRRKGLVKTVDSAGNKVYEQIF
jgi:Mn-dependent DtxR family transcriptional regulator